MAEPVVVNLTFPLGTDNVSRETALPDGAARAIENLDVTRSGGLLCRKGERLVAAGSFHSLHTTPNFLLLVRNGVLSRMSTTESITSIVTLTPDASVSYAEMNGDVFWTTPYQTGRVTAAGDSDYWGINVPPATVASAVSSGGLQAGRYLVTQTAVLPSGLESGAPSPTAVDVVAGGGVQVTVPSGGTFAIYITPPNGAAEDLRLATIMESGSTAIIGTAPTGRLLESLWAIKPPPGQLICVFKGRLWVAANSVLWFTSERSPYWLFSAFGYFQFSGRITMLGAVEDGLFVGTNDGVWFLSGTNPTDMTMRQVSEVGAAKGTGPPDLPFNAFLSDGMPRTRPCVWMDMNGFLCVGLLSGNVIRPTDTRYSVGALSQFYTTFYRHEGIEQLFIVADADFNASVNAVDLPVDIVRTHGASLG